MEYLQVLSAEQSNAMKSDSIKDFGELLLLFTTWCYLKSTLHFWRSRHNAVLKNLNQSLFCLTTCLNTVSPVQLYHLLDWEPNDKTPLQPTQLQQNPTKPPNCGMTVRKDNVYNAWETNESVLPIASSSKAKTSTKSKLLLT